MVLHFIFDLLGAVFHTLWNVAGALTGFALKALSAISSVLLWPLKTGLSFLEDLWGLPLGWTLLCLLGGVILILVVLTLLGLVILRLKQRQ